MSTKFTPETIDKLISAFQRGATTPEACSYAGIRPGTFNRWYGKGQDPDCEYRWENFVMAVDAARNERTTFLRKIVEDDAQGNLRHRETIITTTEGPDGVTTIETEKIKTIPSAASAKWLLEHHDRANYGKQSRQEVEHSGEVQVQTVIEMHGGGAPINFDGQEDPEDPVQPDE